MSGAVASPAAVHRAATEALRTWTAPHPDQERLRADFLAYLRDHDDALRRQCVPAHLTASAVVLDPSRTATLLVLHGKLGRWVQPGGHVEDGDESLAEAARREVGEETGLDDVDVSAQPAHLSRHGAPCRTGARWHLDVQYAVTAPPTAVPVVSAESLDAAWFDVGALPGELADGVADSVRAACVAAAGGGGR